MKLDDLIIEKHILCLLKFFNKNKAQTKSSKIIILMDTLRKPSFKTFNLGGIIIKKNSVKLIQDGGCSAPRERSTVPCRRESRGHAAATQSRRRGAR